MLLGGKAGSVGELVAEVNRLTASLKKDYRDPEEIWFRGQSRASDLLLPQLYRPEIERYNYDEATLMQRFRALATPLLTRLPNEDKEWEWYFLARHHGLPSRLLDWSESLLTAVHFALAAHLPADRLKLDETCKTAPPAPLYDDTCPSIWLLDAGSLNDAAIRTDTLIAPVQLKDYLPEGIAKKLPRNALPIAILPPRGNERIAAQQGTFTVHGHKRICIAALAAANRKIKLARVILDRSRVAHLWNELELLGVNRMTLFPDLDSVAAHVCWIHQSAR